MTLAGRVRPWGRGGLGASRPSQTRESFAYYTMKE